MRILALVTDAFGGVGGIAQYNRDVITALAASDVASVHVLPRVAAAPIQFLPKKVTQADPLLARLAYSLQAFREVLRWRPDLLFCGHLYMAPLTHHLANLIGAPFVVQLHGTEIWKEPTKAQVRALERAEIVLAVSRHTRAQVLRFTRARPEKVVVAPNTVGNDFRPGNRADCRAALGLTNEFVLLTVGRLDKREGYKGHDRVIDAIARLPKASGSLIYLISGDGEDRPRLEALAAERGVSKSVRFLGYTPRSKLPDVYRAADLFVMPSTGEGFGIVFLEAMASGTPALGLAVGGATDPLDFGEWGKAVTAEAFETALHAMLSRPRADAVNMHDLVNRRFGFDVFAGHVASQIAERFSSSRIPAQR